MLSILVEGQFVVRWSVFGVLAGGIIFGSVSEISSNISAAITCGVGSGAFNIIFFHYFYSKINLKRVIDSYGIFSILGVSLMSTVGLAPAILKIFYTLNWVLTSLQSTANPNGDVVPSNKIVIYQLVYPGICAGSGAILGALVNFLLRVFS